MKRTLSDFWTSKPKKCPNSRDTTTSTTIEATHTSDDDQADQPTEPSISVTSMLPLKKNSVTIKKLSFLCLATTGDTAVSLANNFDSDSEFIDNNETLTWSLPSSLTAYSISSNSTHLILEESQHSEHTSSSSKSAVHDLSQDKSEKPRQPTGINFPSSSFGNKGVSRSFKESWYARYPWLEYSISLNSAFCFPCRFFLVSSDSVFTSNGYSDWKHALGKHGMFESHSSSKQHIESMSAWKDYEKRIASDQSIGLHAVR